PDPQRHSRLLMNLQYADEANPTDLLVAHREWDAHYARPLLDPSLQSPFFPRAGRPLRLGFVSADFGRHPTGFLVLPALEHLDKAACSIVCYSDRTQEDEFTVRFRSAASAWRVFHGWSDEDVAEQFRSYNL